MAEEEKSGEPVKDKNELEIMKVFDVTYIMLKFRSSKWPSCCVLLIFHEARVAFCLTLPAGRVVTITTGCNCHASNGPFLVFSRHIWCNVIFMCGTSIVLRKRPLSLYCAGPNWPKKATLNVHALVASIPLLAESPDCNFAWRLLNAPSVTTVDAPPNVFSTQAILHRKPLHNFIGCSNKCRCVDD